MNVVWIVVIVVVVVVAVAAVVMSRRGPGRVATKPPTEAEERSDEPAPLGSARTEEKPADVEPASPDAPEAVRTPAPPPPKRVVPEEEESAPDVQAEAPPAEEARPTEAREDASPEAETDAVEEPAAAAAAEPEKPRLSGEEIRSRLETQLADSERMIEELKEATPGDEEVVEGSDLAGTVRIIEEGLEEVRSLAKREQWSQAKDKGEALHAQLALMLQTARRGGSS